MPKLRAKMEPFNVGTTDLPRNMRVCPACKLLQWEENGKTHTRFPVVKKVMPGEGVA